MYPCDSDTRPDAIQCNAAPGTNTSINKLYWSLLNAAGAQVAKVGTDGGGPLSGLTA